MQPVRAAQQEPLILHLVKPFLDAHLVLLAPIRQRLLPRVFLIAARAQRDNTLIMSASLHVLVVLMVFNLLLALSLHMTQLHQSVSHLYAIR
jgi:hypothetical protein